MATILIAGDPESKQFAESAYGDLAQVKFASSISEARAILESNPPSLLIGTLAFDDSQFLTLLPLTDTKGIKVVIVDCPATILKDEMIDLIRQTAKELRVVAWWNMRATVLKDGLDVAAKEIRQIVKDALGSPPLLPLSQPL